ncbi:MAG: DUF6291 domain-containing protein [Faecousia sp.]
MSILDITMQDMAWFKFFGGHYQPFVKMASREVAGDVFKAVCAYVCEDEVPELTDPLAKALFASIKKDVDDSYASYVKQVHGGQKGGETAAENRRTQ